MDEIRQFKFVIVSFTYILYGYIPNVTICLDLKISASAEDCLLFECVILF